MSGAGGGRVLLLACGSFNPPTYMHLRMFEIARDHFQAQGTQVVGGVISPVHDAYGKKGLLAAKHRCAMVRLALRTSDWIKLSDWEVHQEGWTKTRMSLQYHQNVINGYVSAGDGDAPSWLPDDILNVTNACDRTDNIMNGNIYDNSNLNYGNETNKTRIQVKLLCGADLLESFSTPGLWADEDLEAILGNHGLVVVSRAGTDPAKFIYESDMLYRFRHNVTLVTNWVSNEVSSTVLRRLLRRGESIKYLTDDAIAMYVKQYGLYGAIQTENTTEYSLLSELIERYDEKSPQDVTMTTPTETNFKNILISIRDRPTIIDETITVKRQKKTNFIMPNTRTDSISPMFDTMPKLAYTDHVPASFVPGKAVKIVANSKRSHTIVKDDEEVSKCRITETDFDTKYKRRVSADNVDKNDRSNVTKVVSTKSLGGAIKKERFSLGSIKKSLSEVARLSDRVRNMSVKERDYKTRSCNDIVRLVLTKHGIQVISDTEAIV